MQKGTLYYLWMEAGELFPSVLNQGFNLTARAVHFHTELGGSISRCVFKMNINSQHNDLTHECAQQRKSRSETSEPLNSL